LEEVVVPTKLRPRLAASAFGARASAEEARTALLFGAVGVAVAAVCLLLAEDKPAWWQWLILVVLAFDLVGGVAANATVAATRQYHRPDARYRPLLFAAGHVQPFVVALVFPGFGWSLAAILYGAGCVGVLGVLLMPIAVKRAFALGYCAGALALLPMLDPPAAFAWLAPAYLIKLVAAHAVPMWRLDVPRS
jgi:hypothetical protein